MNPLGEHARNSDFVHLLHLSDLHFRPDTRVAGQRESFIEVFEQGLRPVFEEAPFDLVVVTGDLVDNSTWWRSATAHRRSMINARRFLVRLCRSLGVSAAKRLVVIPGNHDVRFMGLNLARGERRARAAAAPFNAAFRRYLGDRAYPELGVLLACFDSNVVSRRQDLARGSVAQAEFNRVAEWVRGVAVAHPAITRVALVHHHPLPVAGAEVLGTSGAIERLLGRPVGSPEDMLLRNSGVFLHRLLDSGFRLVLHGHLHKRGYWRAHNATHEREERWIEVISGGSMGPGPDYSYNAVKLYRDGRIESVHHGFNAAFEHEVPQRVTTAPYETVRLTAQDVDADRQHVRCAAHLRTWSVRADHCSLETREQIRGLRPDGPGARSELVLHGACSGLTFTDVFARRLHAEGSTEIAVTTSHSTAKMPVPPGTLVATDHRLALDPPLTAEEPLTIAVRRRSEGVIYRSLEDKALLGFPGGDRSATDFLSTKVHWPTDQLVVRLRFDAGPGGASTASGRALPDRVDLSVTDANGVASRHEANSSHVVFDYPPARRRAAGDQLSTEAILSVLRPRLGHTYKLTWPIPKEDALSRPDDLRRLRTALLGLGRHADGANRANRLALAAISLYNDVVQSDRVDPPATASAYVHAFDAQAASLHCVCVGFAQPMEGDPMAGSFSYGSDGIGSAFRSRDVWAYAQSHPVGTAEFRPAGDFPADTVAACLACPLNWPTIGDWPVGVLTICTREPNEPLGAWVRDPERLSSLARAIGNLWVNTCGQVLAEP